MQEIGIDIKAMYIIGLPSDTEETYLKTLKFSKLIVSTYAQFSVFTPYPGTPAFENYKDKIIANKYEDFNQWQLVFKHENFDKNKIRELLDLSYKSYYFRLSWILKFLKNFKSMLITILGSSGFIGSNFNKILKKKYKIIKLDLRKFDYLLNEKKLIEFYFII